MRIIALKIIINFQRDYTMKNKFILLETCDPLHTSEMKPAPKKPKKRNYLNNKDLLAEVAASKARGEMTPKFAHMLQTLCARYGSKGNYSGYSYNEDMQAYAMMSLCNSWKNFNEEKSQNPFAYYTQCIKSSFAQFLNSEKKQRITRDTLLVDAGLNPSYTFQMEYGQEKRGRDVHVIDAPTTDHYGSFDVYHTGND
jgi:hypothetical protein